ncbi:hypothetical protein JCM5353_002984, partial [Sporobolomyces roseus]
MLDWATEMKDTFLPSGIAREYLKSQEWWKEIERFFNDMDTRMDGGSGISELTNHGTWIVSTRFTAKALLDSIETYHAPPPSNIDILSSHLSAQAHQLSPSSQTVTRVSNHGRIQRPRLSNANT